MELSLAAAKLNFTNAWADSQSLDPVEATNQFFDSLRQTADILDSLDFNKKSGRAHRTANVHFQDPSPDTTEDDQPDDESLLEAFRACLNPDLAIPSDLC